MNSEIELDEIIEKIKESNSIVILCHESPDGDAIGSSLAMYLGLKKLGKDVDVICDKFSKCFNFLEGSSNVLDESNKKYDLCICLDCDSKNRLYDKNNLFDNSSYRVSIDHHISNTYYADSNYVEGNSPANCQIIYKLLKRLGISIDVSIGECLMSGIITDSGGFKNNNVNSETFKLASEMMELGVNVTDIYFKVFTAQTKSQFLLSKIASERLELLNKSRVAFTYILMDDMKKVHAEIGDHEGIVNIGRNIDGVEVSIFVRESDNGFKVSLRSNSYVDVSLIAKEFDGGGHERAAGIDINDSFDNVKKLVLKETYKRL